MQHDGLGLSLSGADTEAVTHYEAARRELQCYVGDPIATVDGAIAASPGFVMAHVLKAWLYLLSTEAGAQATARACWQAASVLPGDARERGHVAAIGLLLDGRWAAVSRTLEDVTIDQPRDALGPQVGHLVDFYRGDARMLRDRIARALPHWDAAMPGYHAILGMRAFGLEECGDYAGAEAAGKRGVELERRDGWAQHAVAHVLEMQGRLDDGIAWMRADPPAWSEGSFFCVHNWWHLALYHLERGETGEVLALFDGPVFGARSMVVLDLIDASALLWRLHLRGVDIGDRWQAVADNWQAADTAGLYAFNDIHAMMAIVGAGRRDAAAAVLAAQERAMAADTDNAAFTREVGRPLALAIRACGDGDWR
ncbi:MAG: tetratricopeptide repeat protein, partial [Alphaproteobacteria bacterium]|nr:tetratricopeptide repeat protein [Alphaproteobacteria bacterium]